MIVVRRVPSQFAQAVSNENCSLTVSMNSIYLSDITSQTLDISWNLPATPNMIDWIGLFDFDCKDSLNYLDHRGRGVVGGRQGTVSWNIPRANLPNAIKRIYFAYIDGLTGCVVAKSQPINVTNRANLQIREVSFSGSREKINSVTVSIGSHSAEIPIRTPKPIEEISSNLPFCSESVLSIAVGSSRVRIPISEIETLSSDLTISLPTGHREQFTLVLNVSIEPTTESVMTSHPEWRSSLVSPSSSGSSMSQASSSGSSSHLSAPLTTALPKGWESCTDKNGRMFYIDHSTKRTTWQRPTVPPKMMEQQSDENTNKRYSMVRRTVGLSPPPFCSSAAQLFLTREDFVSLLHENQPALSAYNASTLLKHMIHRIRKCGDSCEKFEGQRDFVDFVNLFADTSQPLPPHWQASGSKPTVFMDHGARRTTLLDPRLPTSSMAERKRGRSAPPTRRNRTDSNGNMLDIVNRTEEIASLVEKRMPELAPKIRKKLRLIERLGHLALNRMANDVDLIMAISILDADDPVATSELEEKLSHFYTSLHRSGYGKGPQRVKLRFSRSNLLRDAFDQILSSDASLLKKAKLSITFDDEDGLDYGGPSRELFFLLSRELFNPYYGLFQYASDDKYTVQISTNSSHVENDCRWFELAGRVLGLALLHRCLIDTFFSATFYKTLLEQPISLQDMASVDSEFYRSLLWLRENPVDENMGMTFVATEKVNGEVLEKELLPKGSELSVTDSNKEEFISLMLKWKVEHGTEKQTRALLRGLHQIIDRDFLRVFSAEQLELVLSGTLEINLDDWRCNTEYRGGYYDDHVVIEWFWSTVEQMTNADRLKLLQFVTGTSSVPFEGFAMLRGSNGPKRFTIEKWGDEDSLPRAHTCFNRLDLPCYPTRHTLRAKLFTAITEGINYAIE